MASGYPGAGGTMGGIPPQAPPPVPRSHNNACLIWGLAGCGGLVLLPVVLIGYAFWQVGSNKGAKSLFQSALSAPQCGVSLGQVRAALEDYRRANKGQYPPDLSTLVPTYMHPDILDSCGGDIKQLG